MKKLIIAAMILAPFTAGAEIYESKRIGMGKLDGMLAKYAAHEQPSMQQSAVRKWLGIPVKEVNAGTLSEINEYVNNRISYVNEAPGTDYWQAPHETEKMKSGDCEDYAIYKWHLLKHRGVAESDMFFLLGNVPGEGYHVVLSVKLEGREYFLDNFQPDINKLSINPDVWNKFNRTTHIIKVENK